MKIHLPPLFNHCPKFWINFINNLQVIYGDANFWDKNCNNLVKKELQLYDAYIMVNEKGYVLSDNTLVFNNPKYYTLFMLRFA